MRKQTKIAAIFSAAALLAMGASMTAFAAQAQGWQEENGTWVYYDRYGVQVTAEWEKSGDQWFYLGDDGEMVTDSLVYHNENTYYVDSKGAMVTNKWVEVDNLDESEDAAPTVWYYFGSNGKAYRTINGKTYFKEINGKKYAFDSEGKMLYGWVDENATVVHGDDAWRNADYYLGSYNDGAMKTGWQQLHVIDNDEVNEPDQDYWFYFRDNGKKYKRTGGYFEKTINGKKYTFDEHGKMESEWVLHVATPTSAIESYKYFSSPEDGARKTKGWFKVLPAENVDQQNSAEFDANEQWFYADGRGNLYANAVKTINGKKYLFGKKGELLDGLRYIQYDSSNIFKLVSISDKINTEEKVEKYVGFDTNYSSVQNSKTGVYYFAPANTDGSMQIGLVNLSIEGDSYQFKFRTSGTFKGKGLDGKERDGYYVNGRKVKADSDLRYGVYEVRNNRVVKKLNSIDLCDWNNAVRYPNNSYRAGEVKYLGSETSYLVSTLENSNDDVVVLTSSGAVVRSGDKKDLNDVTLRVKNSKLVGAFAKQ